MFDSQESTETMTKQCKKHYGLERLIFEIVISNETFLYSIIYLHELAHCLYSFFIVNHWLLNLKINAYIIKFQCL